MALEEPQIHGNSKYTEERKKRVLAALRAGNTLSAAAKYAEISPQTLKRWMEDLEGFAAEVSKAEADAEVGTVAVIRQAMPKTWQAAAWWLERRRGDEWRVKQELDVNHNVTIGDLFRKFTVAGAVSTPIEQVDYDAEAAATTAAMNDAEDQSAFSALDKEIDEAADQLPPTPPQKDGDLLIGDPDDTVA